MGSPVPRPRRDWRWFLGLTGRIFITLGLLMLAFVAYQLWGTGIEFRSSQDALARDFRQLQQSTTVAAGPTSTAAAPTSIPPTSQATTTVVETSTVETTEAGPIGATAPDDTEADVVTSTTGAPLTSIKPGGIELGDLVASIRMPTISKKTYYIVAGVRTQDLKRGVGHYPGTPLPGQFGNAALAGHRTTYGHPFENVDRLKPGDPIDVDLPDGTHYEYVVESQEIILPDDTEVLMQPTDPKQALLTLTTCHPKRSTKRRLVIHARLDETASSPLGDHTANYVIVPPRGGGSGSGTKPNTTVASNSTVAGATTVPTTQVPATEVPASTTVTTTEATGTTDPDASDQDRADLARGWFHDRSAWPQIALWGGLLVIISLGGWWVARRTQRRWLGWVVAAAPFIVTLYFFFQNVNRLLPPGL